ncbi:hypothetical protein GK047_12385 [Paenibacillus sp. SYP-B3998]|uniref:Uncharacterized protein n=1 Tax=Paenibacillus sp. SYP-B3998 TaxID=2678564 RepID=A0A6G3ZYZ8_9BACL|nr:hypothetical protein [Paenibacillus sp. SYP-B3998]NEW06809.1 hypothetical protein [Paenibacillus sp. SYP-B3998]
MNKIRGKRRYFKKLWSKIESHQLHVEKDAWYDLWHRHLDFGGLGNNSLKIRREHIKAHLHLYSRFLKQLENFNKPYQTWVCIHEEDSGADAIYVHSPNPNSEVFPLNLDYIKWDCKLPQTFNDLIDVTQYNVGYYESEIERVYYIESKILHFPLDAMKHKFD